VNTGAAFADLRAAEKAVAYWETRLAGLADGDGGYARRALEAERQHLERARRYLELCGVRQVQGS
jgi:hypothetical protein